MPFLKKKRFLLDVNGDRVAVEATPETPLLWILRDELALTGTKVGCGIAECGACTVHLDGRAVPSCAVPVSAVGESPVVTIEHEARSPHARALIEAWIEEDVPQCGYCQPGMVMASVALLRANAHPSSAQIDEALGTHICRCGTYLRIRKAVSRAARGR